VLSKPPEAGALESGSHLVRLAPDPAAARQWVAQLMKARAPSLGKIDRPAAGD